MDDVLERERANAAAKNRAAERRMKLSVVSHIHGCTLSLLYSGTHQDTSLDKLLILKNIPDCSDEALFASCA